MENLVSKIDPQTVKDYQITEAFMIDDELYITSNYSLTHILNDIENQIRCK